MIIFKSAISEKRGKWQRPESGPKNSGSVTAVASFASVTRLVSGTENAPPPRASVFPQGCDPIPLTMRSNGGIRRPRAPRSQNAILPSCTAQPRSRPVCPAEINAERAPRSTPFTSRVDFNSQVIKHGKEGLIIKMLTNPNPARLP